MRFQYNNVCLEGLAYTLPEEVVTSDEIEARLAPLYSRLKLPPGRLELMSGIRERRFWPPGMLPSSQSAVTADRLLNQLDFDRSQVGALIHGSVCRDQLEPATACSVHHGLKLSPHCAVHDVSNACLGLLSGIVQVANLIELGQIEAGLVVGTESGRTLVESTIEHLNADQTLDRNRVKLAVASLTIGSASAAALLVNRRLSVTQNRLLGGVMLADTTQHTLCQGGHVAGGPLLMQTDSERLMQTGVELAATTFEEFCDTLGWGPASIEKTFGHQVGQAHRKLLLRTLGLDESRDFATYSFLGNTGSVALPVTVALGEERGHLAPADQVALLGIGSGLNCIMLGVDWQTVRTASGAHLRRKPLVAF